MNFVGEERKSLTQSEVDDAFRCPGRASFGIKNVLLLLSFVDDNAFRIKAGVPLINIYVPSGCGAYAIRNISVGLPRKHGTAHESIVCQARYHEFLAHTGVSLQKIFGGKGFFLADFLAQTVQT